jgi:apolipoprotein N-acyltransferase
MKLALAGRWPILALCLTCGAAAALAFPPFGFVPGLLAYGGMMRLWDGADADRPLRSAFWRGWLAGTAFFLISTWWVYEAFQVDAAEQGWMAPFAVALLAAGLGLFWGVAALAYRAAAAKGLLRVVVFAGVFCSAEWVRGHLLTGFPWDLPGEAWRAGSAPSQAAAVFGAYGLSFITVAASAALALAVDYRDRRARIAAGAGFSVVLVLYGAGAWRLAHSAPIAANAPVVRIVQPDEHEQPTYSADDFRAIVARYVALTGSPASKAPDVVIWPEGAIPAAANDYLAPGSWTLPAIARALAPGESLIVGAYRVAGTETAPLYYNTLVVSREGAGGLAPTAVYDKYRLVPFGEYMPADALMGRLGFKKLVHVGDGFSSGPRPAPIRPQGLPAVQPLICYEALFPGLARGGQSPADRAAWIVNVSDDAWFGRTYGPLQHLNLASYRAIETGLPMARATPTGVSAMIDAYGRIAPGASLAQGVMGVIDRPLPPALPPTLFVRFGETFFYGFIGLAVAAGVVSRRAPF